MDSERRVVRLDSFSKIVSPGLRLGFVTGPKQVLEKMICHLQSSSVHPSGLSQVIALAIYHFLRIHHLLFVTMARLKSLKNKYMRH